MGPLAAVLLLFVQVTFREKKKKKKMGFPGAQSFLCLSGSFQSRKHAALKPTLLCPQPPGTSPVSISACPASYLPEVLSLGQ